MQHLERALDKQNQWWKYPVVFGADIIVAGFTGVIALIPVIAYQTSGDIPLGALTNPAKYGVSLNLQLLILLLPFVVSLIVVTRLISRLHKRSLPEIVNGTASIRWRRFFWGALVWASLTVIWFSVEYGINPGNYKFNFQASSFIPLLLISVLLIPLQASFEEILFRGYLAQGLAAWTRNRWVVLIIPSLLFGLVHIANPEIAEYGFWLTMPSYVLFGLVFGLIAILDDGIEIAMGAHAVNNIFGSVLVTFKSSALATPALFYQLHVDPNRENVILVAMCLAFVAILSYKYKWKYSVMNKKVQPEAIITAKNSSEHDITAVGIFPD